MQGRGKVWREKWQPQCEWGCEGASKRGWGLPEAFNPGLFWGGAPGGVLVGPGLSLGLGFGDSKSTEIHCEWRCKRACNVLRCLHWKKAVIIFRLGQGGSRNVNPIHCRTANSSQAMKRSFHPLSGGLVPDAGWIVVATDIIEFVVRTTSINWY